MNRRAARILDDLDIEVDVTQPLGSYSVAIQQMAAIAPGARHLVGADPHPRRADLEPRRPRDRAALRGDAQAARATGIAIVFITHFLDQVYAVSDRDHGPPQRATGRHLRPAGPARASS